MSPLGSFHTVAASIALASGAAVLIRRKGTRWHRRAGWTYAVSMILLNVTALMIYRLFGYFGPFHVAAVLSLATVSGGTIAAVRRRPRGKWIETHFYLMAFSYVGLVAAAFAEVATRVPGARFWWVVLVVSFLIILVGTRWIKSRAADMLRPFARRQKEELADFA